MTNMVLLSEGGIRNHPLHPNHPYHYPSKPICIRKPHKGVEWESRSRPSPPASLPPRFMLRKRRRRRPFPSGSPPPSDPFPVNEPVKDGRSAVGKEEPGAVAVGWRKLATAESDGGLRKSRRRSRATIPPSSVVHSQPASPEQWWKERDCASGGVGGRECGHGTSFHRRTRWGSGSPLPFMTSLPLYGMYDTSL